MYVLHFVFVLHCITLSFYFGLFEKTLFLEYHNEVLRSFTKFYEAYQSLPKFNVRYIKQCHYLVEDHPNPKMMNLKDL